VTNPMIVEKRSQRASKRISSKEMAHIWFMWIRLKGFWRNEGGQRTPLRHKGKDSYETKNEGDERPGEADPDLNVV